MRSKVRTALAAVLIASCAPPSLAQAPLSAIDWLSDTVAGPEPAAPRSDLAVAALPPAVTVHPLAAPSPDRVALQSAAMAGVPPGLWGASSTARIAALVAFDSAAALPALRDLHLALLTASIDPPADSSADPVLFLARVDTAMRLGALDVAARLLDRLDGDTPETFRRRFDIALLTGRDDVGCARLRAAPTVAPSWSARIFCLARTGDWPTAALTLETARALGDLDPAAHALAARFLHDGAEESEPAGPDQAPPRRPTPLEAAMYEAVGEPLDTRLLPLAFAHLDLRPVAGWKARIAAGERLTRAGALAPEEMWAIWTERQAAASGGAWDRVTAVQAVDRALLSGDRAAVAEALPPAWATLRAAGLDYPLARLYGATLAGMDLAGPAGNIALTAGLLSPDAARVAVAAQARAGLAPATRFLLSLADGTPAGTAPDDRAAALAEGFAPEAQPPDRLAALIADNRAGEAALAAFALFETGEAGNPGALRDAVATLRAAGLGHVAAAAAMQVMLLDRRG